MKSATSRCTLTLSLTHPISPPPCSGESLSPTLASTDMRKRRLKIAHTTLSGRVDGREVTLNDDRGDVRGGLYRRHPWFGTDRARSYPARPFRAPCRDSARRHTSGSCLALLGGPPPSSAPAWTSRRLHGESSSPNFHGCLTSNGDGLLAQSNYRLRFRRQQSRSGRERVVFPLRRLAGSHIHPYQAMTVWVGHSCPTIS